MEEDQRKGRVCPSRRKFKGLEKGRFMVEKFDLYGLQKELPKIIVTFSKNQAISTQNRKDILSFIDYLGLENLSASRKIKYIRTLSTLSKLYGRDFTNANRSDIEELLKKILKADNYRPHTIKDFKVALKRFFKWLRKSEDYPDEVRFLKASVKQKERVNPDELFTLDEVEKIESVASKLQYRLMVRLFYFSGARPSELLNLRFGDYYFKSSFLILKVAGKTGQRDIPIYDDPTIDMFNKYIRLFSDPESKDFVFKNNLGHHYTPNAFLLQLKRMIKKAGVTKPAFTYNFRHSRISGISNDISDQAMKQFFGWKPASQMLNVYVHRDIDKLLQAFDDLSPQAKQEQKARLEIKKRELVNELLSDNEVQNYLIDIIKKKGMTSKFEDYIQFAGILDRVNKT
jgi:integrase